MQLFNTGIFSVFFVKHSKTSLIKHLTTSLDSEKFLKSSNQTFNKIFIKKHRLRLSTEMIFEGCCFEALNHKNTTY